MKTTEDRPVPGSGVGVEDAPHVPDVSAAVPGEAPEAGGPGGGAGVSGPGAGSPAAGWAVPGVGKADGLGEPGESVAGAAGSAGSGEGDLGGSADGDGGGGGGGGGHPVLVAVHDALVALRSARDASVATLSAGEVKTLVLAVVQIIAQATALKLRLLVAGDRVRVADTLGASSTAAFLAHLTQSVRAAASAEVRLAKDLEARFSLIGQALAAGLMSPAQVTVAVSMLRRFGRGTDPEALAACQRLLIDASASHDPQALSRLGRRLWEVVDPDGADAAEGKRLRDEEERARLRAWFASWRNGDGTTGFKGRLPDAQADMLIKALQAYAAPRRRTSNRSTTASGQTATHDAPTTDATPDSGETGAAGAAGATTSDPGGSGADTRSGADDVPGASSARDGLDEPQPEERETGRSMPYPAVLGNALMDLVDHLPCGVVPDAGGVAATVVVTIDHETLANGVGVATLDSGTQISAAQARRMACNAGILPCVMDGASVPLDLGREQRLYNKSQRVAMGQRDKGCVAETCDRPPAWCEAHHKRPWAQGGRTDIADGALLCFYHHHLAHDDGWHIIWLPDGRARFRRRC